ncbi:MAG: cation diffusion facilitator family transporter [Sediminibacterium sp.]|nr:cation diffusion facilitator family transporter [Sediminibacterium sp.]
MIPTKNILRIQYLVLLIAAILFVLKLGIFFITHSSAVLSDALETIINLVAGAFGLWSLYVSKKPKDLDHPYGHGKIEFLAAGLEGGLIIMSGVYIIFYSIFSFLKETGINQLNTGILLVIISVLINSVFGWITLKAGTKYNSIVLTSSGKHLILDGLTSIVILINFIIIKYTHWIWVDNISAFILALIIIFNGYKIIRRSIAGIMDEADQTLIKSFLSSLNNSRNENWIDLHNLRVIKYGRHLHIDCHLTLPWYLNIVEGHQEVKDFEKCLTENFGQSIEFFIHSDFCHDFSCSICTKQNCNSRINPFQKKINWDYEHCSFNQQHKLNI